MLGHAYLFFFYLWGVCIVLKPGSARWVDPGMEPVRVEAKTRLGIGLVKPGRPGTRSTLPNPGETQPLFFLLSLSLNDAV